MRIKPTQDTLIIQPIHEFQIPDRNDFNESNHVEPLAAFTVIEIGTAVEAIKKGDTVYIRPENVSANTVGESMFFTCREYAIQFTLEK